MEVNELIAKLKANGTSEDFCDLNVIRDEYTVIYKKLDTKYKGQFALNILCILCRNIDKAPSWKDKIDNKVLILLSIECAKQAKGLSKEEQVKALACLYHLHKHAILQKISSELVLQLSHLPFEEDNKNLLKDYHKTYWAIIVDRLTFIEKYKTMKADISKILPVLTSDIKKLLFIYDHVLFYQDILLFLIKKLNYLFNDINNRELDETFEQILSNLLKSEFKIPKNNYYNYFKIYNECFKIIIENSFKDTFNNLVIETYIKLGLKMFDSDADILDSIKVFYVNVLKAILNEKPDVNILEDNLNKLTDLLEKVNKATIIITPYINHILRLFLENSEKFNEIEFKENFPFKLKEIYLKIVYILMKKMYKTEQLLKCENCTCKSGLHDSLRLGFSVRQFVTTTLKHNLVLSDQILEQIHKTFELQTKIVTLLKQNKCANIEKYEFKSQSNTHNLAILLDEKKYFECSLKLFDLYLKNEVNNVNLESKNVTRGFYNKSICELDAKKFDSALKDAFLSLVMSFTDKSLISQKYMSLVIDIKSKWPNEEQNAMISSTVLDACTKYIKEPIYGCLKHIFVKLNFIELLKHEYSIYEQLWPSTIPIYGVWNSFMDLINGTHNWLAVESEDGVLLVLSKIIFKTVNAVRTIHYEGLEKVITELIGILINKKKNNLTYKIIYATLLVLKSEFKMAECSDKYEWKSIDKNKDPENICVTRNLAQEFEAIEDCFKSFDEWMKIYTLVLKDEKQSEWIKLSLLINQLMVHIYFHAGYISQALQMSYICTQLALYAENINIYALNVGILMYNTKFKSEPIENLFCAISKNLPHLMNSGCKDTILTCISEAAIYFISIGNKVLAANLLQFVLVQVAQDFENNCNNYIMTVGRLLEAQEKLNEGANKMSRLSTIQKHWFGKLDKTSWLSYTQKNLQKKYNGVMCTLDLTRLWSKLYLWRRARSSVFVAGIMEASALCQLFLDISNVHRPEDTQVNIENRLKYILYSTNGNKIIKNEDEKIFKEKLEIEDNNIKVENLEIMMEAKHLSNHDKSPLTITTIPAFKQPSFMIHEKECPCYICINALNSIFALNIIRLETFMYFRNNEFEIAKNYFDGLLKMLSNVEMRINNFIEQLKLKKFENFVIEIIKNNLTNEFKKAHLEILIENAFFELAQCNYENSDDIIVQIQELSDNFQNVDVYIKDSFMNLLATAYKIKEKAPEIKISDETCLENDFSNLKLSPDNRIQKELQKTPENRPTKPPKDPNTIKIYTDDEIPKLNLKIKKLNLDSTSPEKKVTKAKKDKKEEFKIPVPKISKPQPEIVTPRTTRFKPKVIVSQTSVEKDSKNNFITPKKPPKLETPGFFTPITKTESEKLTFETPVNSEQFFTPVSNLKTYSKKTMRNQIVKSLEQEFATPISSKNQNVANEEKKEVKTKVETGCLKAIKDKRSLKRATSPGKLVSEVKKVETKTGVKKTVRNKVLPFSPEEDLTKKINLRAKR